jgi:glycosyltransferase involved in cell wall biosynthesis
VRDGLQSARLVVAPSQAMLDALDSHYGPLPSTQVIPNGRKVEAQHGAGSVAGKQPFVLSVGRLWDEAKNVRALDDVARALPWPVFVAGDCIHPSGGQLAMQNLRTLGRIDSTQLARLYAQAAIYALPARYEPFGLSVLEAAMAGCALVLGDIDSLREIWGDAALYVAPDDTDALRGTLLRLIGDDALRRAMGQRAQLRAMRYTPAKMATSYWELYQMLRVEAALPAAHRRPSRSAVADYEQPRALNPR